MEHVARVQKGSSGPGVWGRDARAVFVVARPFGDVGEERPDLCGGYVQGDGFVGHEGGGCAGGEVGWEGYGGLGCHFGGVVWEEEYCLVVMECGDLENEENVR
jgi:hypothetical protein